MSANPTSTSTSTSNHFSPPPLQFPAENAPAPAPSNQPLLRHLAALSLITFFSIWGTLTREGLVALNTYNGNSVKPLIWAQAVGCLAMGWCIGNQKQIEGWYTPLYIGLATGYCGSVTTFSSWMLQVFQAFGDQEHFHRGGLHNVMDALTQTSITFGMSLISLKAGQSISKSLTFEIILILLTPSRWGEIRSESREEGEKIERDELDEEIVEETERAEKDEERDAIYPPANLESEDGNKKQGSEVVGRETEIKRDGLDDRIVGEMEKAEREEICGRTKDDSTQNSNSTSTSNTTSTQSNLRSSEPRRKSKLPQPRRSEDISISKDSTSNRLSPTFTKDLIFISIGPILWISSIFLCIFKPDSNFRPITFSIVFSPLGSILRWYLSRFNSISRTKRFPYFPLGTLTANLLATMILSVAFICQHFGRGVGISGSTGGIGNSLLDCNVLYGIQEGFCGTLSTVSTFVVELNKLKPKRRAIGYAGFSWLIGILICVVVVGIPWWSRGMDGSCVGITI